VAVADVGRLRWRRRRGARRVPRITGGNVRVVERVGKVGGVVPVATQGEVVVDAEMSTLNCCARNK
jgi:hypothetical protein